MLQGSEGKCVQNGWLPYGRQQLSNMTDPHQHSKKRKVTEDDIDVAARRTRGNLERLLDVVEGRVRNRGEVAPPVPRPLCLEVDLDFLSDHKGLPIGLKHKPEHFTAQLAVCNACLLKDDCLESGLTEEFGVWGGALPAERRRLR